MRSAQPSSVLQPELVSSKDAGHLEQFDAAEYGRRVRHVLGAPGAAAGAENAGELVGDHGCGSTFVLCTAHASTVAP